MSRRRLVWKVAPAYLLVIVLCTVVVAWLAGEAVRPIYLRNLSTELLEKAKVISLQIQGLLDRGDSDQIAGLTTQLGPAAGVRVTVIDGSGKVLGDSEENPLEMENHADRHEIQQARTSGNGESTRYSQTLKTDMMYVAVAVREQGQTAVFVRTAIPTTQVKAALQSIYWNITLGGLVMAVVAGALMLMVFNRQIHRPLRQLQTGALRFARGELDRMLVVGETDEIASLTEALNTMARQLDEKISTMRDQASEREAILASMIEGVLAVDGDQKIITINEAAGRLLDVHEHQAQGRSVIEVIRNHELQKFVVRAIDSKAPIESEVEIVLDERRHVISVHGTRLQAAQQGGRGAVIVMHDVTRLRQLEVIRQQFVANVSHELKTPITAIKAAIETLIEDDGSQPDASDRFKAMIARQTDRLRAIVEDLLTLARIEQDKEQGQITFESGLPVQNVLNGAVETCQAKADSKKIRIDVECEEGLVARMNAALLEQAVVNLLDNAIKYSTPASIAGLKAYSTEKEVVIEVRDKGVGIEREHLSRLFERFYRTDKARSRDLGGTGLGLAIVKHIAQAHGGRVSVDSIPTPSEEHGSVFRVHLPRR